VTKKGGSAGSPRSVFSKIGHVGILFNSSHHIVDSAAIFRRPLARKMASYALLLNQSILTIPKFTLECGSVIKEVPIAYKTWGNLNETRDNVMVICHAFTGSADVEDW